MKKLLLILLCLPLMTLAQQTYVPDNDFEAYLEANGMGNGIPNDDYVTTSNISSVLSLDVSYQNITDLTGIEDFASLTYLDCGVNQLTNLDVSNNPNLVHLDCRYNQITSVNLSSNMFLEQFISQGSPIASLNFNNLDSLKHVNSKDNQLTSLTVNNCPLLLTLNCQNSNLTNLDVSSNPLLISLACSNNQLINLDLTNNQNLENIMCEDNQIITLDLSNHVHIEQLICNNNQLTSLDLITTNLYNLSCYDNYLTSLDVSNNSSMEYLQCFNNQLLNLNMTNCTSLRVLDCRNNQLTSLNTNGFSLLYQVYCSDNNIISLDISTNPNLNIFQCLDNQLISLDARFGSNNLYNFCSRGNPNLFCISVNNPSLFFAWTVSGGYIDSNTVLSYNCPPPVLGCMDSLACNYDTLANINDSSCVYPTSSIDSVGTFCDSYTWIDGITYTNNNNTAIYTLTNSSGCDSVITLDLIINYSTTLIENQSVCDFYTWPINGAIYSSSIIDTFFTTNANGCPETNILDLVVNYSTTNISSVTVCDSYTWIDGVTYTVSNNTATYITTNPSGCDNIATLDLTITGNPISSIIQNGTSLEVTIADTYIWNTGEITQMITPTTNGLYWCIVTDSSGCVGDTAFYSVTNIVSALTEIINAKKTLLKVTDLLGRETKRKNTPLFYIYDDGTVEKRITIE